MPSPIVVLLVDDDVAGRLLAERLGAREGWHVAFSDGSRLDDVTRQFGAVLPDVVLLDRHLHGDAEGGDKVAARLKNDTRALNTTRRSHGERDYEPFVILFTAHQGQHAALLGRAEIDDVLVRNEDLTYEDIAAQVRRGAAYARGRGRVLGIGDGALRVHLAAKEGRGGWVCSVREADRVVRCIHNGVDGDTEVLVKGMAAEVFKLLARHINQEVRSEALSEALDGSQDPRQYVYELRRQLRESLALEWADVDAILPRASNNRYRLIGVLI